MKYIVFISLIIIFGIIYYLIQKFVYTEFSSIINNNLAVIFTILASSGYIIGFSLEYFFSNKITDLVIYSGAILWGFELYFLISIIILKTINLAILSKTTVVTENKLVIIATIFAILISSYAYINAHKFQTKTIIIKSKKIKKPINIVFFSDLHLGTLTSRNYIKKIVNNINKLKPDIILIGGDLLDSHLKSILKRQMGNEINILSSKYGVYAVSGNHEYIGGINQSLKFIKNLNISILDDTCITIDSAINIIGRKDYSGQKFTNTKRKKVIDLLPKNNFFTIIVDHQPNDYKSEKGKADLVLSGHTHNGQLFPFNLITKLIFKNSWGLIKLDNTFFYTSSGVGTWGPPMRTGSINEIINIRIEL